MQGRSEATAALPLPHSSGWSADGKLLSPIQHDRETQRERDRNIPISEKREKQIPNK